MKAKRFDTTMLAAKTVAACEPPEGIEFTCASTELGEAWSRRDFMSWSTAVKPPFNSEPGCLWLF